MAQLEQPLEIGRALTDGDLFIASSGEVSPGTGEAFAIELVNPSDSGVDLYPRWVQSSNSVGYVPGFVSENPTNAPSGLNGTGGGQIDADRELDDTPPASINAGGISSDLDNRNGIVLPLHDTYQLPETHLKVPPGGSLAIQGGATGGLLAGENATSVVYYERRAP